MDINRHIQQLLYYHDCVIIPGLGGFVCNYKPASVHPVTHIFRPPSKSTAFNKSLSTNDGLLISFISRKENISYRKATDEVNQFAEKIKRVLKQQQSYIFPKIGKLSYDVERNLQFKPDYSENYLLDSFGLTVVEAKPPVLAKQTAPAAPLVAEEQPEPEATRHIIGKRKRRKRSYASAFFLTVILLLAGLLAIQLIHSGHTGVKEKISQIKNIEIQDTNIISFFRDLWPFGKKQEQLPVEEQPEQPQPQRGEPDPAWEEIEEPATEPESNPVEETPEDEAKEETPSPESTEENSNNKQTASAEPEKTAAEEANSTSTEAANVSTSASSPAKYYVIVGSFKDEYNAKKLQRKLQRQSFNSDVIPAGNGFFRVGINGFTDKEEAKNQLPQIKQKVNPQAWITEAK